MLDEFERAMQGTTLDKLGRADRTPGSRHLLLHHLSPLMVRAAFHQPKNMLTICHGEVGYDHLAMIFEHRHEELLNAGRYHQRRNSFAYSWGPPISLPAAVVSAPCGGRHHVKWAPSPPHHASRSPHGG